ncbi:MAG: hypothetical protein MPJ50_10790 [Pirellulales bacterium]|nr:hypothetical protein [Pirellulales bacterium]
MNRLFTNSGRGLTALTVAFGLLVAVAFCAPAQASEMPVVCNSATTSYYAYIACESEDEVALVRLIAPENGAPKLEVVERIRVGIYDLEIEGPHGLGISLDGEHWFVSIAHGRPFGLLYKYSTSTNELVGELELGMFPASMQVSEKTGLMHIVNFNLHGGHEPSTVSIVEPDAMVELERITTGIMPHGSRFSPGGAKHYSLSMMTDELFEIDAVKLAITRTLNVHSGEGVMRMMKGSHGQGGHGSHDKGHGSGHQTGHKADAGTMHDKHGSTGHGDHKKDQQMGGQHKSGQHQTGQHGDAKHAAQHGGQHSSGQHGGDAQHGAHHHAIAKPTWVQLHPTKPLAYVANNGAAEVVEINLDEWKITRRFSTGKGPYNVEVTPDGTKFVVTYKSDAATGIWDIESGKELARVENSRKVPHGIAITPDSRFAIVSVEGIGGEPGGVDAIDLTTLKRVDVVNIGKQAGGIVFWKMEEE